MEGVAACCGHWCWLHAGGCHHQILLSHDPQEERSFSRQQCQECCSGIVAPGSAGAHVVHQSLAWLSAPDVAPDYASVCLCPTFQLAVASPVSSRQCWLFKLRLFSSYWTTYSSAGLMERAIQHCLQELCVIRCCKKVIVLMTSDRR